MTAVMIFGFTDIGPDNVTLETPVAAISVITNGNHSVSVTGT